MKTLFTAALMVAMTYAQLLSRFVPTKIETTSQETPTVEIGAKFEGCYLTMSNFTLFIYPNTTAPYPVFFKIKMTDEIVDGERKGVVSFYN